jgi:predicted enzyme related to lactoylglutathione lyase
MANIDKYAPGSFCWFELGTSDQDAAKEFYKSLFGWGAMDLPMGPDGIYTMFQLDGRTPGAAYTLKPEMVASHVPPHWGIYIAADSADETAAKAAQAGGKLMMPPFDVFDVGRMSLVQDPTGAYFHIWQEKRASTNGIAGVPGTFCWADLMTRDAEAAKKFYGEVFGWQILPGENDNSGYLHIKNGETFIGGMPPAQMIPPNVPAHFMLYFYVTDTDASSALVKELGGKVHMGPMTIEKVGRMSVVTDPQGAVFSLFTPEKH